MRDEVTLFGSLVVTFKAGRLVGHRWWRCVTVDYVTQQVCDSESRCYTVDVTLLLLNLVEYDCVFQICIYVCPFFS